MSLVCLFLIYFCNTLTKTAQFNELSTHKASLPDFQTSEDRDQPEHLFKIIGTTEHLELIEAGGELPSLWSWAGWSEALQSANQTICLLVEPYCTHNGEKLPLNFGHYKYNRPDRVKDISTLVGHSVWSSRERRGGRVNQRERKREREVNDGQVNENRKTEKIKRCLLSLSA